MTRSRVAVVTALVVLGCLLGGAGYQLGRYRSRNGVYRTQALMAFANYVTYRDIAGYLEHKCYDPALAEAASMRDVQIVVLSDNLRRTGNSPGLLAYLRSRDPELLKSVLAGHIPKFRSFTTTGCVVAVPRVQAIVPITQQPTTLEFRLVDEQNNPSQAHQSGNVPTGGKVYRRRDGSAILLERDAVVTSDEITDVTEDTRQQDPTVFVQLDARGAASIRRATSENIGHRMAVVYSGTVINDAVIRGVFGADFQLGGLATEEARALVRRFHHAK